MADLDVASLKVAELKAELSKRGLKVSGLKKELSERLQEALDKESQETPAADATEEQTDAGTKRKRDEQDAEVTESTQAAQTDVVTEEEPASKKVKTDEKPREQRSATPSPIVEKKLTQDLDIPKADNDSEERKAVQSEQAKSAETAVEKENADLQPSTQKAAPQDVVMDAQAEEPAQDTSEPPVEVLNDSKPSDGSNTIQEDSSKPMGTDTPSRSSSKTLEAAPAVSKARSISKSPSPPAAAKKSRERSRSLSPSRSVSPPPRKRRYSSRSRSMSRSPSRSRSRSPPRKQKDVSPPPSTSLYLTNLVRPFVVPALKELLEEHGKLDKFWIDSVKSHAYLTFDTKEAAIAARSALHGQQWPENTGKNLAFSFIPTSKIDSLISEEDQAKITRRGRLELLIESSSSEEDGFSYRLIPFGSAASSALSTNLAVAGIPSRGLASAVPLQARGLDIDALPSARDVATSRDRDARREMDNRERDRGWDSRRNVSGSSSIRPPSSGAFAGPSRYSDGPSNGRGSGFGARDAPPPRRDGTRFTKTQPSISYREY